MELFLKKLGNGQDNDKENDKENDIENHYCPIKKGNSIFETVEL